MNSKKLLVICLALIAIPFVGCGKSREVDADGLYQASKDFGQSRRIRQLEERVEALEKQATQSH